MARAMPYGWGRVPYDWENRRPWLDLPFPVEEYEARIGKIRRLMAEKHLDTLIVHGHSGDFANIRYLSNYEIFGAGEAVVVLPAAGRPALVTNAVMHGEPMHSGIHQTWMEDARAAPATRSVVGISKFDTVADHVEDMLRERGLTRARLGYVGEYARPLEETIAARFAETSAARADDILTQARAIKSDAEVEVLRRCTNIADVALKACMDAVREGVTEHDLCAEAYYSLMKEGADGPAFSIAMVAGPRCGFKHVGPTNRKLQRGDIVYVDIGARYRGYCSDTSRHRTVGDPTPEQRRFMETQIQILDACIAGMRPGVRSGDLAPMAQEMARGAGYENEFYYRGHGIGCGIFELPSIHPKDQMPLEPNMVFVHEPMLVRAGFGTACVEDMYRVTPSGCERLSTCPVRWW
ncbi:MAG: aminopeptidase P family protein [Armatimonadetes bacterium]|nr:aminopeptidase P family protein [Armatimonadota bacterium]